jgi:DNA-binding winged helix-turn-helix (wHTH) protein/TolB-like protein/Tfp pilus assembly protein PilF
MESSGNYRIVFGEFELDRAHRRLYRDGDTVALYAKAFELLDFLVRRNGEVVSKDELLANVWPDQFVEEANLSVQISALRKALGETKNEPRFLVTVPGVGYKFTAEIKARNVEGEIAIERPTIERMSTVEPDDEPGQLPGARSGRLLWMYAVAGLGLTALLVFVLFRVYDAPKKQIGSLAVLPFVNEKEDSSLEYLNQGLAESVIDSLSGGSSLRIMSRNSAFRFKGNEPDAKSIGNELNVDAILTGRITTIGDDLSVRAELISTDDNSVIWVETFTRKLTDAAGLQSDIARSISDKLRLKLSNAIENRLKTTQTNNADAYRLFLQGRYHLNKFTDDGSFKGRDYFQQAIDKDPNYALAWAGLAEAYNRLCGYNAMRSSECFPKSRIAAEKAIELGPQLADAYATLGSVKHFYDWDWDGAEKNFQRAIEIDSNNSQAYQLYSYHLTGMGRFDESLHMMRKAHELDPLSVEKSIGIAEILYFQKRYDEALAGANNTLALDKNAGFVHWIIGNTYLQQGRLADAIAQYEKSIPLSGESPDERASLAYTYAIAGRKDDARRILKDLNQRSSQQFISPCILAIVHAGLDEKDEAFAYLERGYSERDFMMTLLKIEPTYDRLRDDPRYAELMRRVGF